MLYFTDVDGCDCPLHFTQTFVGNCSNPVTDKALKPLMIFNEVQHWSVTECKMKNQRITLLVYSNVTYLEDMLSASLMMSLKRRKS